MFPEAEAEAENLPDDKPRQPTRPQEQSTGDTMGRDPGVSFKVNERWNRWAWAGRWRQKLGDRPYPLSILYFSKAVGLQPAGDANLP